jgi:apolipoprotein N-acyltransferase
MGHTQTPILAMCQIADVLGVYGVSFWVVMVNALLALLIVERVRFALLIGATALTAGLLIAILGYGIFRFAQSRHTLSAGPKVLVVQPNYPQDNSGSKGAPQEDIVRFHVEATRSALAKNPDVDLVVWSETMMPPVNAEAREIMRGSSEGKLLEDAHQQIASIAFEHHCAVLAGGLYLGDWREKGKDIVPFDRRNTAFFYNRAGMLSDIRYDKIHLVPFGEFIPFKYIPPAYQFFEWLSPYGNDDYTLTAGGDDALTVYTLEPNPTVTTRQQRSSAAPWRFVAPICFEDIDSGLVARMFRGGTSSFRNSGKKADFIVNITNDGWFMANEMPQHLQAAVFRSIENRAPTARSVNTGISGFIDPMGRTNGLIPSGQEGTSVRTLTLDRRLAPYTRIGDAFAIACTIIAAGVAVMLPWRACRRRKIEGNK